MLSQGALTLHMHYMLGIEALRIYLHEKRWESHMHAGSQALQSWALQSCQMNSAVRCARTTLPAYA